MGPDREGFVTISKNDAPTGGKMGRLAFAPAATTNLPLDLHQDFRAFPDGSAAYAAPGSSATKIKILRVMPCP